MEQMHFYFFYEYLKAACFCGWGAWVTGNFMSIFKDTVQYGVFFSSLKLILVTEFYSIYDAFPSPRKRLTITGWCRPQGSVLPTAIAMVTGPLKNIPASLSSDCIFLLFLVIKMDYQGFFSPCKPFTHTLSSSRADEGFGRIKVDQTQTSWLWRGKLKIGVV